MPTIDKASFTEAVSALQANLTQRQLDLETLERYIAGTQYAGRESWFSASDTPLWERAPCIVYGIGASAIRSHTSLVLGEGRFPIITSNPGEDDSEAEGLDEEESKATDRAISALAERVRFRTVARQALWHAMEARSVATIAGTRGGIPFLENVRARWCAKPTFDACGNVTSLEIRYPYLEEVKQADGSIKVVSLLYRRVIDATTDTTFKPLPANAGGREPKPEMWEPLEVLTHGLGFCPVHWYAYMRECSIASEYDGKAIHETQLDEMRGLDFAISQRHRAALFCGDPQIIETGVEPGYNPSGPGRTAVVASTLRGGTPSADNPITGGYVDQATRAARIKSPGVVWQYESPETKVFALVLPPGALDALSNEAKSLRLILCEALSFCPLDPDDTKLAASSGKALEALRGRQYDYAGQIQEDFGNGWLRPVMLLLLRVALKTNLALPAVRKAKAALAAFVAGGIAAPMLSIRWPLSFSKSDPADDQIVVTAVVAAYGAKLITRRMAIQKLAPLLGIENVDQALEAVEAEDEARSARALDIMRGQAAVKPLANDGEPSNDKKPAPFGGAKMKDAAE